MNWVTGSFDRSRISRIVQRMAASQSALKYAPTMTPAMMPVFSGLPPGQLMAGRSIVTSIATDPATDASETRQASC